MYDIVWENGMHSSVQAIEVLLSLNNDCMHFLTFIYCSFDLNGLICTIKSAY